MVTYCYFNGKMMSVNQAMVSVYDIGLVRGYGIYEAFTTHNKKPFRLEDHIDRFRKSALAFNLKVNQTDEELESVILELIELNKFKETNIKIILTGGKMVGGIDYDFDFPNFYILAEEFVPLATNYIKNGASLITHEHERQYPQFKTTNYITGVLMQGERKAKGALEILYISKNGYVLEASTSNFFLVKGDTIVTPKDGILLGITRKVVIELANGAGIKIEERDVRKEELREASEAFITASFKEVVPVVLVDDNKVGTGEVGDITKKVIKLFGEYTEKY